MPIPHRPRPILQLGNLSLPLHALGYQGFQPGHVPLDEFQVSFGLRTYRTGLWWDNIRITALGK